MRIERAMRIKQEAKMAIADIFSSAAHFGLPHDTMLQRRAETYQRLGVSKCPVWVSTYLQGYWEAKQEQAYRDSLVFGAMIDGKFYSTHSNRDDYYEKHGFSPSEYAALKKNNVGHYWQASLKPFFLSAE